MNKIFASAVFASLLLVAPTAQASQFSDPGLFAAANAGLVTPHGVWDGR